MFQKSLVIVLVIACLFSAFSLSVHAHTPTGYAKASAYKADSNYYNDHFITYINVQTFVSTAWESHHAEGTLTHKNENGDTWAIYYHTMYSGGYLNYSSSIHGSHAHTADYSSHYDQFYYEKYITKGSNKISFNINYKLRRYPGGPVVENEYMVRSRTNF